MTTATGKSAKGTAVVDMWAAPMPDPDKPAAGFPVLERAEHSKVYHATKEKGGYSHHAQLIVHDGVFYAMWSNHPHGEDSPGQFVRFSVSRDGENWSEPQRLFPPYADFKPFRALGPFGTAQAGGWIIHEGKLYGLMGILDTVGFANTDRSSTREKRDHEHKFRVKRFLGVVEAGKRDRFVLTVVRGRGRVAGCPEPHASRRGASCFTS